MKQMNHHEEMIRYGEPFLGATRRKRRGFAVLNYNDRSPEVAAMNAHLRASAYGETKGGNETRPVSSLTTRGAVARNRARSFLGLGSQYDTQARDNFVSEVVLFALIATLAVWPIIHAVQALVARW